VNSQQEIADMLHSAMGFDAAALSESAACRAVKKRMAQCGQPNESSYLMHLKASPLELSQLIEELVVPETWFFRDGKPFEALQCYVMEEWLAVNPERPLRLLSVPCSSGEEPYSAVMALLDAGLLPERIYVEGIDISNVALAKAQQGLYGKNSFRGVSPDLQGRHFTNTPHGWLLNGPIRKLVNFSQGNLLNGDFALTRGNYDVIFCRNLLIYFNDKNREQALSTLDRMLLPQGILFVGHAESAPVLDKFFTPIVSSQAFAYRKKGVGSARESSLPASSRDNTGRRKQPRSLAPKNPTSPMRPIAQAVSDIGKEKYTLNALEQAQQYADQGKLSDAEALCERSLREQGASAQAYYLLGLVHDAGCEAENARAYFNKAVYLEPDHYEALVQLALLAERQGDAHNAAQLRKRAQRAALRRGKK
jgi:chemotaxis protein methyltransferase WspC